MKRRTFIGTLAGGLLVAPLAAEGQQAGKAYRLGLMLGSSVSASAHLVDAFRQGMRELDWVEGKNFELEVRAAERKFDRFPAIVAELLRLRVDVIIAPTFVAARAAKNATSTVPILIVVAGDVVGAGLVDSLARPGGNITGLIMMSVETQAKQLEILKEAISLLTARSPEEIGDVFLTMIRGRSDAFLVVSDPLFSLHRKRLAELGAKARLPGMFP